MKTIHKLKVKVFSIINLKFLFYLRGRDHSRKRPRMANHLYPLYWISLFDSGVQPNPRPNLCVLALLPTWMNEWTLKTQQYMILFFGRLYWNWKKRKKKNIRCPYFSYISQPYFTLRILNSYNIRVRKMSPIDEYPR